MEKFILSKLHPHLYLAPPSDLTRNQRFNLRCQSPALAAPPPPGAARVFYTAGVRGGAGGVEEDGGVQGAEG